MTEVQFLEFINDARSSELNATAIPRRLVNCLKELPVEEIVDFGHLLNRFWRAYDWRLWAAASVMLTGVVTMIFTNSVIGSLRKGIRSMIRRWMILIR